jgi:hypothetical protein
MTSEEKVLIEIKEKIELLFTKIAELKVTEQERKDFEKERDSFQERVDDYKKHKLALDKRWNISPQ